MQILTHARIQESRPLPSYGLTIIVRASESSTGSAFQLEAKEERKRETLAEWCTRSRVHPSRIGQNAIICAAPKRRGAGKCNLFVCPGEREHRCW